MKSTMDGRSYVFHEFKWCPGCHLNYSIMWFAPSEHCGSPAAYHHLCRTCQNTWRKYWAVQLADYFAKVPVAA